MSVTPSHLPLHGIRILDLTRALAGPMATTLLADLGADVVKVEPIDGEMIRRWAPFDGETSLYDVSVNRNKRSLTLDFRSDDGKQLLRSLALKSDVLVENFRAGVLAELGLSPESLKVDAPQLIVASISGFGPAGPLRDEPCFDQVVQGMAGLMSLTGEPGGTGYRVGIPIADILAGMFTALGVAAALAGRIGESTTVTRVETSLLESALGVLTFQAQRYLNLDEVPPAAGNEHPVLAPYGIFATADVPINIAAATDDQWSRLCTAINAPELADDRLFRTSRDRTLNRRYLQKRLEERLTQATADAWEQRLRKAGIPVGPVQDMAGVFSHPQVRATEMVTTVEHPVLGPTFVLRGPFRLENRPVTAYRSPPTLSQHTREVLTEHGLSSGDIDDLVARGVIGPAT